MQHDYYAQHSALFTQVNGVEAVEHFGDPTAELAALRTTAGIIDLSFRSRLCLGGADRVRFLNGQVTNNVKDLRPGLGCYAALVTGKGRLESDLHIYNLGNELLLDFEPGLAAAVSARLEKYIIADDVQIVDVAAHYGLISVEGPAARSAVDALKVGVELPMEPARVATVNDSALGEIYLISHPRLGTSGYDLFVPQHSMVAVWEKLVATSDASGARASGWQAWEMARMEAGIPRFGIDMDETNLAPEAGLDQRAISYSKGCYIGQEVIARIRTYGQVAKALRRLRLADDLKNLPLNGDKLFHNGAEVGYLTSALASPTLRSNIAFGYVRKEINQIGAKLTIRVGREESEVTIVGLPFEPFS